MLKFSPVKKFKQWRLSKVIPESSDVTEDAPSEEVQGRSDTCTPSREFVVGNIQRVSKNGELLITGLPRAILVCIVEYLPKDDTLVAMMLSCKTFYNAIQEERVWKRDLLPVHNHVLPPILLRTLVCLARTRDSLTAINFSGNVSVTDPLLDYLAKNFPGISSVDLSGCTQVTDAGLVKLCMELTKLTSLDVSHTYHISCIALKKVLLKHKWAMKRLNLSQAVGLLEKFETGSTENVTNVAVLPTLCINLEHLVYRWDRSMGHDHRIYSLNLSYLFQCCTHLKSVDISGCNLESNLSQGLKAALKAAELTSLTLNNDGLSDASLVAILNGVSSLENLDISNGHRFTAYSLRRLSFMPQLKKIKDFNVSHCYNVNNDVVRAMLQLTAIRHLRLAYCHSVDDDSLMLVTQCPSLCYIDVSGTSLTKSMHDLIKKEANGVLVMKAEDCPYNTSQVQHFKDISMPNLDELHHVVPQDQDEGEQEDSE